MNWASKIGQLGPPQTAPDPASPSKKKHKNRDFLNHDYVDGLKTFLNIGYYHGIVPFHIKYDEDGNLEVTTNIWSKVFVTLMTLMNVSFRCYETWDTHVNISEWRPPNFFEAFYGFFGITYNTSFWYTVWRRHDFLLLFQWMKETQTLPDLPKRYKSLGTILPYLYWAVIFASTFSLVFMATVIDVQPMSEAEFWDAQTWFNAYIMKGKQWLHFHKTTEINDLHEQPTTWVNWSISDICVGSFMLFCLYFRYIVGMYEEFIVTMLVLPAWFSAAGFVAQVDTFRKEGNVSDGERNHGRQWKILKQSYLAVRKTVDVVNNVVWPLIFAHTVLIIFYYSFIFDKIMMTGSNTFRVKVFLYTANGALFYYLGADVCSKMDKLNEWIFKVNMEHDEMGTHESIPSGELAAVVNDLQANRVGISGGTFTITHGLLTSVAGVVLTYFILMLQFR